MLLQRAPCPPLRPFVKTLWATDGATPVRTGVTRERLLPTGDMHLVFRLSDHPLRVFETIDDERGWLAGQCLIGGARDGFYVKDAQQPTHSVGAVLCPGAAHALLGDHASTFSGRHTSLEDVWGRTAILAREQLIETCGLARQLDVFESILAARLPRVRGLHPAVAQALSQLQITSDVRAAVRSSGYSHRRFIELFEHAVGLTPKVHCRLLRFRRAVDRIHSGALSSWAGLAFETGYSDQAHLIREFRTFAGVTPLEYRRLAPSSAMHVPILDRG